MARFTEPVHGTAKLFAGVATGLIVQLPYWRYPAFIDTATGTVPYDNFGGRWEVRYETVLSWRQRLSL